MSTLFTESDMFYVGLKCNCDKDNGQWHEDSGIVTDKSLLPIKRLFFGDTQAQSEGKLTVGPLICSSQGKTYFQVKSRLQDVLI